MGSDDEEPVDRRQFLGTLGTVGTISLAGCIDQVIGSGTQPDQPTTSSPTPSTTASTTTETTARDTTTTETTVETPPKETTDKAPSTETTTTETTSTPTSTAEPEIKGTINAHPSNPDADWADAEIFQILNGETTYELDLGEARNRSNDIDHWGSIFPKLDEVAENSHKSQYRKEIIQEYAGDEYDDFVDWELWTSDEPLDKRYIDSRMVDYLLAVENVVFDYVTSAHNEHEAALLQAIDPNEILYFGHSSKRGNHGLISIIENPTYNENEFDQQETYWIETDPGQDQQAGELSEEDCPYLRNDNYPTETDWSVKNLLKQTIGNTNYTTEGRELNTGWIEMPIDDFDIDSGIAERYGEFLKGDQSNESGQYFIDMMAAAYELGMDPRLSGKRISVSEDQIEVT